MDAIPSEGINLFEYLSENLYTYLDIDDSTSILILKNTNTSNIYSKKFLSNTTYNLLSALLNTARTGSAHKHAGISLSAFLTSILMSFMIFIIQAIIFILLRNHLKELYQTTILSKYHSSSEISSNSVSSIINGELNENATYFGWIKTVYKANMEKYLKSSGVDAYLFIRYLYVLIFFNLTLAVVIIPVLLPIHICSGSKDEMDFATTSLDILNMSNISSDNSNMLIFHFLLTIFVVIWFHVVLLNELRFIKNLSSSDYVLQNKSQLLFVDNIPNEYVTHTIKIKNYFNKILPDSAMEVIPLPLSINKLRKENSKLKRLDNKIEIKLLHIVLYKYFSQSQENVRIVNVLNKKYLRIFWNKNKIKFYFRKVAFWIRTSHNHFHFKTKRKEIQFNVFNGIRFKIFILQRRTFLETAYSQLQDLVSAKNSCQKYFQNEMTVTNSQRNEDDERELLIGQHQGYYNKVFVSFGSKFSAYMVGSFLNSFNIDTWNTALILPNTKGIIWSNLLKTKNYKTLLRSGFAFTISVFVILGWIIPVAFITLISHIPYLTSLIPIISKLNNQPTIISKLLNSVIPILSLVIITELVPFIYRYLSYIRYCRTQEELEINIQLWFFIFLFVHLFIVVTISSGMSLLIEKIINNPVMITTLLAHELPKSSNFFCSFVIIRGFTYSGGNFLQIKELILELFYYPTRYYSTKKKIKKMEKSLCYSWGSIYPLFSVLGCIGIIYSVISPIILPICSLSFFLIFFSVKYQFEFQCCGVNIAETNGILYINALTQLYTGIYCLEFSMIGLFTLYNSYRLSFAMLLLFIITLVIHHNISLNRISKIHKPTIKSITDNSSWNCPSYSSYTENNKLFSILNFDIGRTILIPQDPLDIGTKERSFIFNKYGMKCEFDKTTISTTGTITYL
ncbi:hypothetical protein TPHA_0E03010 [Tetrapisispora phaffii CBS 4417]|uniref:CSC1/OSCA1-like 7TM region domain-containing protein n=1 Tax=Tetrapisispora phaffii (strain ATCC 24235 / CBS 4417 / NBRC 1672 / NRRL Y-8282 / UCD 70-5) TaxID=1071381 RepID=G8BU13_TETPH|nr:hypothetical protein TPHA_0E03010 [Tetrapisispora phaffii CBS 4417]CCE63391.1 hypothetical protein TPHA_0E03010 [Tetrapisispora phaffii CBS 4417]